MIRHIILFCVFFLVVCSQVLPRPENSGDRNSNGLLSNYLLKVFRYRDDVEKNTTETANLTTPLFSRTNNKQVPRHFIQPIKSEQSTVEFQENLSNSTIFGPYEPNNTLTTEDMMLNEVKPVNSNNNNISLSALKAIFNSPPVYGPIESETINTNASNANIPLKRKFDEIFGNKFESKENKTESNKGLSDLTDRFFLDGGCENGKVRVLEMCVVPHQ